MRKESYPPISKWRRAEAKFQSLPLKDGEFTVCVSPRNGQAYNVLARTKGEVKQTFPIDGADFKSLTDMGMKKVSTLELDKREKNQ